MHDQENPLLVMSYLSIWQLYHLSHQKTHLKKQKMLQKKDSNLVAQILEKKNKKIDRKKMQI